MHLVLRQTVTSWLVCLLGWVEIHFSQSLETFLNESFPRLKGEGEVAQLCPTLCDPVDCSLPGSSVQGILQARILEWVAISFSRESSRPRDRTRVSGIGGRRFNLWAKIWILSPLPWSYILTQILVTSDINFWVWVWFWAWMAITSIALIPGFSYNRANLFINSVGTTAESKGRVKGCSQSCSHNSTRCFFDWLIQSKGVVFLWLAWVGTHPPWCFQDKDQFLENQLFCYKRGVWNWDYTFPVILWKWGRVYFFK